MAAREGRGRPARATSIDEAGNQWFTLPGRSEHGAADRRPPRLGAERRLARRLPERARRRRGAAPDRRGGRRRRCTVRLVNWADEEGARFGRSLFGSSAAAGSMRDQDELREARRPRRRRAARRAARARRRPRRARRTRARSSRTRAPTSSCTSSRARCSSRWTCRSASCSARSASSARASPGAARPRTPARRRWTSAATRSPARRSWRSRSARSRAEVGDGAVCTSGGVVCKPGIVTSVVETAEQLLDQRHLDADAARRGCSRWRRRRRSGSPPRRTSRSRGSGSGRSSRSSSTTTLIELADEAIREVAGTSHRLPSGPLHDAAEVSRAGVPTVMLFVQSLRGLSHTKLEDTKPEHLELSVAGARPARVEDARARRRRGLTVRKSHLRALEPAGTLAAWTRS